MRNLLVLLLFYGYAVSGQNDSDRAADALYDETQKIWDSIYNDENYGVAYHNEDRLEGDSIRAVLDKLKLKTLLIYKSIIDEYPASIYFVKSLFHSGEIQVELSNYDEAKKNFQRIVDHANAIPADKNYALIELARIAIDEKDFEGCLRCLEESKNYKIFDPWSDAYEMDRYFTEPLFRRCYKELGIKP